MHTYQRRDGTFYDAAEPEDDADAPLPLRPSEVHQWDGRRWVWTGHSITHSFPREDDCEPITKQQIKDMLVTLHETIAIQEYQGRMLEESRRAVNVVYAQMTEHLNEARPLMKALAEVQILAKYSVIVVKWMGRIWKLFIYGTALLGIVWGLAHGDMATIKRAAGLFHSGG